MKRVKEFRQSKKAMILIFVLAAILILAGGIGGTRAALSVYSEQYNSRLQTSDIGISLYENEILAAQRDYDPDAGNYSWKESGTGLLCQKLIGLDGKEDAELKIGKSYQEKLMVKNSGKIPVYTRVLIWKYWAETDQEGNVTKKRTDLDPDLIELQFLENNGWIMAEGDDALSKEYIVLYYTKQLASGEETSLIADSFRINDRVMDIVSETSTKDASGATVVTVTYEYDGMQFVIEAEADAVQTHNAHAAILSAWGREAAFDGNEITAIK